MNENVPIEAGWDFSLLGLGLDDDAESYLSWWWTTEMGGENPPLFTNTGVMSPFVLPKPWNTRQEIENEISEFGSEIADLHYLRHDMFANIIRDKRVLGNSRYDAQTRVQARTMIRDARLIRQRALERIHWLRNIWRTWQNVLDRMPENDDTGQETHFLDDDDDL